MHCLLRVCGVAALAALGTADLAWGRILSTRDFGPVVIAEGGRVLGAIGPDVGVTFAAADAAPAWRLKSTPVPEETPLRLLYYSLPGGMLNDAVYFQSLAAEAVKRARAPFGTLTESKRVPWQFPEYAPSPRDRLRVKFHNGTTLEFKGINVARDSVFGKDLLLCETIRLSVPQRGEIEFTTRLRPAGANKEELRLASGGWLVIGGKRFTVNKLVLQGTISDNRLGGTFPPARRLQAEFHCTGSVAVKAEDLHMKIDQRLLLDTQGVGKRGVAFVPSEIVYRRKINSSWKQGDAQYVIEDLNVLGLELRGGDKSSNQLKQVRGTLSKNGKARGRFRSMTSGGVRCRLTTGQVIDLN